MEPNRPNIFTLEIEGEADDQHSIWLNAFADQIKALYTVLTGLGNHYAPGEKNQLRILNLTRTNPAQVEIEVVNQSHPASPIHLLDRAEYVFTSLAKGVVPEELGTSALTAIENFSKPVGKKFTALRWYHGDVAIDISSTFASLAKARRSAYFTEIGSIDGRLEQINVHGPKREFSIYPAVGPSSVTCVFPEDLKEDAISALDHKVTVYGTLRYPVADPFPSQIKVTHIEVYPREADLPTFDDLRGISPMSTGGMPAEDFIAQGRREWDA